MSAGWDRRSGRMLAGDGLGEDGEHLAVVLLEGPLGGGFTAGLAAGGTAGGVEQLCQAPGELGVVVRVLDDVALARRMQQFAGAVVSAT